MVKNQSVTEKVYPTASRYSKRLAKRRGHQIDGSGGQHNDVRLFFRFAEQLVVKHSPEEEMQIVQCPVRKKKAAQCVVLDHFSCGELIKLKK
jgi:hypothetical protein